MKIINNIKVMNNQYRELDIGYFNSISKRNELPKRTITQRLVAWELDERYYDGARDVGYGGFRNDGRWNKHIPVLIDEFSIPEYGTIVDLGCKKGFILKAFKDILPKSTLLGIENHRYPIDEAEHDLRPLLRCGPLYKIPLPDNSVDFLISFSAIYMQSLGDVVKTLREIERVSCGRSYVTVGAFSDGLERQAFADWTLIGTTVLSIPEWVEVLDYCDYSGAIFFTTPRVLGLI